MKPILRRLLATLTLSLGLVLGTAGAAVADSAWGTPPSDHHAPLPAPETGLQGPDSTQDAGGDDGPAIAPYDSAWG
ncbi:hypothetical protein ACFQ6Q_00030 [Streptomyces sp. NPDC056437]|uniref:hypothetical protein n=1 Tax=Streptomyces sp. NPDC056437 TaxID=3345816 RepID=UPI0036CCB0ED